MFFAMSKRKRGLSAFCTTIFPAAALGMFDNFFANVLTRRATIYVEKDGSRFERFGLVSDYLLRVMAGLRNCLGRLIL